MAKIWKYLLQNAEHIYNSLLIQFIEVYVLDEYVFFTNFSGLAEWNCLEAYEGVRQLSDFI